MKTYIVSALSPLMTPKDFELIMAGKAIVRGGTADGQIISHKLTPETKPWFEAAKKQGYLEMPRKREGVNNVWWAWCEAYQHPYIVVRALRKWNEVHMDLINMNHQSELSRIIEGELRELCYKYTPVHKDFHYGCWTEFLVDPPRSKTAASELLQIVQSARKKLEAER